MSQKVITLKINIYSFITNEREKKYKLKKITFSQYTGNIFYLIWHEKKKWFINDSITWFFHPVKKKFFTERLS